ncbi:class I SAM-dependent methyltransferase [Dactylosporangium fulvum]|uniref:Class I SAM-dependent methyltransferase n=1 Tax=Dactylosporangium fulvum TaxID=53359 RepID=A0ABY5W790_9ACTN|nr:class I SAM-dependent methyltransferase [Dactylosporangium fulvum]UWP85191.1 class I SAM-dependent methyltransferase [Dactylosporangium fulvum]
MAESFGSDAQRYDQARPGYPDALVARIAAGSTGPDVLDAGCGTGIAARQFQAAGRTVLDILDAVGTAIDTLGGRFTMQYTTLATTAVRTGARSQAVAGE